MKKPVVKRGDVILIKEYLSESDTILNTKYFVVIDSKPNVFDGMYYDIIGIPMSSIKSEIHRVKVFANETNMMVNNSIIKSSDKRSYLRLGKVYFFNRDRIIYKVVDRADSLTLEEMASQIEELEKKNKLEFVTNNVREKMRKNKPQPCRRKK